MQATTSWTPDYLSVETSYNYGSGAGPHAVRSIGAHSGFDCDDTGAVTARWQVGVEDWDQSYGYAADGRLRSTTRSDNGSVPSVVTRTTSVLDAFQRRVARSVEVDGVPTSELLRPNDQIELRDGVAVRTIQALGEAGQEPPDL